MYVRVYVYACTYVRMYVCMDGRMNACMHVMKKWELGDELSRACHTAVISSRLSER